MKVSARVRKKLENIVQLKAELENWKELSEADVLKSLKGFEKTPRDEGSTAYSEHLSDPRFAEVLLDIASEYDANTKISILTVSALGNMIRRYDLPESKRIYDFFVSNSRRKGVSAYVAIFLTKLKTFDDYADDWDYILSIRDMKPSKVATLRFRAIVESRKGDIPSQYRSLVIDHFLEAAQKANSESGRNHFLSIANELKGQ